MQFILVALISTAMFAMVWSALAIHRQPRWFRCRNCCWYYNDRDRSEFSLVMPDASWEWGTCSYCEKLKTKQTK